MSSQMVRGKHEGGFLGILRALALIASLVGAVGSLGFMFHVGRRQSSLILILLFTGWVLSPFVALVLAVIRSKRWSTLTRMALYVLMLILIIASLTIYGYVALGPPRAQPAFFFLMVPLASWLLIAIVVLMAEFGSRRGLRRAAGP